MRSPLKKIEYWGINVPLLQEWASSPEFGEHGHPPTGSASRYLLCVTDEEGNEGWGESTARSSEASLKAQLQQLLAASDPFHRTALLKLTAPGHLYWERPAPPSPYTPDPANLRHRLRNPWQHLIETALNDLLAKRAGVSLAQLWGGPWRTAIEADYWMGRASAETAKRCVLRAKELGFRGIKIKTTLEDPNVERLEAILEAGGPDWKVTVDPNGRFYRLEDALPTIRAMDAVGNMAILEDPFPRFHLPEFKALRSKINARVAVHIDPPETLWDVATSGAAGGLNISHSDQGPTEWRMDAALAERANLSIWHGSGLDLGIATATQLHLAASAPNCRLPGDQAGPWLREATLLKTAFELEDGKIKLPADGPGLGIQVDRDQIEKYTVSRHELVGQP
ncbi:MAG TPA: enolase C-terminal domain-like protein [Chthoniobacteraceae bacterium]|nr:enolase C-terminal domain-like protein [Chthoniobacteraceae bacterium]